MTLSPPSPCVGICSTVYGDQFCRGCKREYREVIAWNGFDATQKQLILSRLQEQLETVVNGFIIITDSQLLKEKVDQFALRPVLYQNPLCWAYELLRLQAMNIQELAEYGIVAKSPYQQLSANALFTKMDDQLYALVQL